MRRRNFQRGGQRFDVEFIGYNVGEWMHSTMREKVRAIIAGTNQQWGRLFDATIIALIMLSAVSLAIETLPDLPDSLRQILRVEEIVVVSVFTAEYALRLWAAERPLGYVFSFWGLIDILAILPFFLALGIDLRGVRVLRLLRLLRILKLVRYMKAMHRLNRAFREIRDELAIFGLMSAMVLYLAAVGIYYFEHEAQPDRFSSIPQALWWSLATLTTVGYGDVYPVTVGGRVFTFFVLLIGLGVVAVPSGLIASALTRIRGEKAMKRHEGADPPADAPDDENSDPS